MIILPVTPRPGSPDTLAVFLVDGIEPAGALPDDACA